MKLTPWFDNSVKPVRPGFYEIRDAGFSGRNFRPWNGEKWSYTYSKEAMDRSGLQLFEMNYFREHGQDMTGWRGVQK